MMAGLEWPRVPAWTHLYFWQLGANSKGIRFYMISPFCGFLFFVLVGFFFFEILFDVSRGFWCIAQFVDAIGWKVLPSQCHLNDSAARSE